MLPSESYPPASTVSRHIVHIGKNLPISKRGLKHFPQKHYEILFISELKISLTKL